MFVKELNKIDGFECPYYYYPKYPYANALCRLTGKKDSKTGIVHGEMFCCVINPILNSVPDNKCPIKKIVKILEKTEGRLWEKFTKKMIS